MDTMRRVAQMAREASSVTAAATSDQKNKVLYSMAEKLSAQRDAIVASNETDIEEARARGIEKNLIDRLRFGTSKIESRIRSLEKIAALPDPVGSIIKDDLLPNGLRAKRVRVPLGVIMMIYEARPHVSVNAGAFCLKSGNACILRGGSEAKQCNEIIGKLWRESLEDAGLTGNAIQLISGTHKDISDLLQQDDCIDLVIPRGGKRLIEAVVEQSRIPVVKHFAGICHVYVDASAPIDDAIDIVLDSKCLMPEVCNAAETVLFADGKEKELRYLVNELRNHGVQVKGCERTRAVVPDIEPATEDDWKTEYLDTILSIRTVAGVGEAIDHINTYGSHHTDSIVTADSNAATAFTQRVDSGVVLVNASTMFCDGESLGMGAEIGISTDKIHARGPMGLEELTSYKFVITGDGHIMGNKRENCSDAKNDG